MSDNIDGLAIIDRHRSADLDDVGGVGWTVAVAIDSDGAEILGVELGNSFGNLELTY